MGTKGRDASRVTESKASFSHKRATKQAAKRAKNEARIDDFFEDNSFRGEDYLNQLRGANPSLLPKQIYPLLKEAFVTAYSEASTQPQKRELIEIFVLTAISLHGISEVEVIRKVITQMEKGIRAIPFAKAKVNAKKLVVPAIEVALFLLQRKMPSGSKIEKFAKNAAVVVPIIKVAVEKGVAKPEAEAQQDELQAHKLIDRIRPILGKLPKTWD